MGAWKNKLVGMDCTPRSLFSRRFANFFFYFLYSLKTQQGLLVDFAQFPQKFIDLLDMCLREEHKEVPK